MLNAGDQDRRVKDVIVAAQAVPGLLPLLEEGRLVIVPGDRHEVILSVCLAAMNGIRLAGLLLTVGLEPDPRVVGAVPPGGRAPGCPSCSPASTATRPRRWCTTSTPRCRSTTPSGPAA